MASWTKERILEFIHIYRRHECLWKVKSKDYTNKIKRDKAYEDLTKFVKSFYPPANKDSVVNKISSLRSSWRKEYKKYYRSKTSGAEVYEPSLFYFPHLLFIVDSEATRKGKVGNSHAFSLNPSQEKSRMSDEHYETSRGHRAIVVNGYKFRIEKQLPTTKKWKCALGGCKARCLTDWDMTNVLHGQLVHNHVKESTCHATAMLKTSELRERCKKRALLEPDELPGNILNKEQGHACGLHPKDYTNIRQAMYRQRAKLQGELSETGGIRTDVTEDDDSKGQTCDSHDEDTDEIGDDRKRDMLRFVTKWDRPTTTETNRPTSSAVKSKKRLVSKRKMASLACSKYEPFGQSAAHDLESMAEEQAIHAKKLISDVLYEGLLGNLSRSSKLLTTPEICNIITPYPLPKVKEERDETPTISNSNPEPGTESANNG